MNSFTARVKGKLWGDADKIVPVFAVVAGILLLGLPLFAQVNLGRISGRVTDQTGGVIAGARVTITNVATGVTRNLTTDLAGQYNAPALTAGAYTVRVSTTGFRTFVRQGILLETGKEVLVDAQLTPGAVTQTVEVTAAPPMINTTNATLGGTLSNQTVNNLPLNGRNYLNLVSLRPGVEQSPGGGSFTLSSNGLRVNSQNYIVDGMDNNESWGGQELINEPAPAGDAATILPIDAISEFNIEENPKAEYGYTSGAVVNVGIKSGTNQIHGTAYAFGRDGSWDARNVFNQGPQNPLGLEQWGGTIGGPIKKDKIFYFAGFEEQRYELGVPEPTTLPTLISSATSSNPAGNPTVSITDAENDLAAQSIPLNLLSLKLLPLYGTSPNANGSAITNLNTHNSSNNVLGKVDYNLNSHNVLSALYFLGNDNNLAEDFPVTQPEFLSIFHQRTQVFTGRWTWIPSARWVNEARFGFDRFYQPAQTFDHNTPADTTYGINTGVTNPLSGGLPLIFVSGLGGGASLGSGIGGNGGWPLFLGPDNNFDFADSVSYLHGNHAFKWGAEWRLAAVKLNFLSFSRGDIQFLGEGAFCVPGPPPDCSTAASTGLEDFLAGNPAFGLLTEGNPARNFHQFYYAAFGQDDWRVSPTLTLNLGLRWEYHSPLTEVNDLLANWTPTQGLISAGGSQGSTLYNTQKTNFSPRFGFAWDITGKGTTVLRGGSAVYYDALPIAGLTANATNLQNFPTAGVGADPTGAYFVNNGVATQPNPNGITSGTLFFPVLNWNITGPVFNIRPLACGDGTTVTSGPAALVGAAPGPCGIFAVAQNFKTPYVIDWTLSLQHAFTNSLSLEITYVGNHGSNLTSVTDANQLNPASAAEIACGHCEANSDRPYGTVYPDLGVINVLGNQYQSNYNGLQTTLSARNYHGMTFVLGYTYAHALDDMAFTIFPTSPQDSTNPAAEYASSDFDSRHRVTLAWTYNVPGINSPGQILKGWTLNTIVTLQGALPWDTYDTGHDISKTGELMDRWDFFGDPSTFSGQGATSIPYFPGTSNSSCVAAAGMVPNGPGGTTGLQSLSQFGCFAEGSDVLVPPAIGSFGFTGRNIFRDSGYRNMDLSVFKDMRFSERLTAQFRAEFFNVLNHPNFANPFGSVTAWGPKFTSDPSAPANFGCGCRTPDVATTDPILGSGGARDVQLGLKFIF